jgi:hypothetical protein
MGLGVDEFRVASETDNSTPRGHDSLALHLGDEKPQPLTLGPGHAGTCVPRR